MQAVGLFEAKQKLSELVERARGGEEIGITRRGELVARLVPASPKRKPTWEEMEADLQAYRKATKLSHDVPIKELIEEGRE